MSDDLTYEDARRLARKLYGASADVEKVDGQAFPARVYVWSNGRRMLVNAGESYKEVLGSPPPAIDKPSRDNPQ